LHYLDHNATSPLRSVARRALTDVLEAGALNASSVHAQGRHARQLVEGARAQILDALGLYGGRLIFTSGATEANNLALRGLPSDHVLVATSEHPSVLEARADAERLPVRADGLLDLQALEAALAASQSSCLVSVMAANNETGAIQPIPAIAELVHAAGSFLHCDIVQAFGRLPPIAWSGADCLTLSAHKLGGPQGVGALVLVNDDLLPHALLRGGGQEGRMRAGTENVAGIAAFGAVAAELARTRPAEQARLADLRDRFENGLKGLVPDAVVFAEAAPRLPNTSCFAQPGQRAETLLIKLDLQGICLSSGAACSSGKVGQSSVLAAMAVPRPLADCALRLSLGWSSEEADIAALLDALAGLPARHRDAVTTEVPQHA